MNGKIIGENENGIGIDVDDNNDVIHEISIEKGSLEIVYHEQDGYPDDPDRRTSDGNEMVDQARDYAKWYVAQNTKHDTAPWYLRSNRIEQVKDAVANLPEDDLNRYFDHYYRQLAGAYDATIAQPRPDPVPPGAAMNEYREHKLDVYLTDDGSDIDATSDVHVMYYAGINDDRLVHGDDPYPARTPDTRLEHVVIDIDRDQFREFLTYHLRCQIRDSYLARGEDPPDEYRVLGPGTDHMMVRCMNRDAVPSYHDYNANVSGYRAEDTFNAGLFAPLLNLL
ncbi:hypothetical protein BDK88_0638 [Natrinema hispanicum]|uniref:Uncharacterized protein n=1 Tax=Natrinema hispanicum TaxID=392421 RepID=A0A482YC36_9EURY|nr:hypothetical protein BDK88_0638 [Natrinema hispanicum]